MNAFVPVSQMAAQPHGYGKVWNSANGGRNWSLDPIPDWAGYLRFRPQLAAAMDPAFYPIDYLDALLLSGAARLWVGAHAAVVAEIRDYPGGARVIHGLVAAGPIEDINLELIPRAEAWAKSQGCTHAIIESRAGWMRALKPHGYAPHQVAIRKEL